MDNEGKHTGASVSYSNVANGKPEGSLNDAGSVDLFKQLTVDSRPTYHTFRR